MNKYKAIIFDLDGTLLDTLEDIANATNEALSEFRFPTFPVEAYKQKVGGGFAQLVERCVPHDTSLEVQQDLLARLVTIYDQKHMDNTKPYAGILPLLEELQSRKIPLAINSNKKQMYMQELVEHFFPTTDFVAVIGQRDGVPTKPSPLGALEIQEQLELPLDSILFIGDSNVDMLTATAAHMVSVGVSWGFRSVEELKEHGAKHIVHHPEEILALVTMK